MRMGTTQAITLLMLKRLHVNPLTMTLGGLKFQKTRVGSVYALYKHSSRTPTNPIPNSRPSLMGQCSLFCTGALS